MNDLVYIGLPRQTVENFAAERQYETDADFTRDEHALCQAAKQALSHPSVTVEGEIERGGETGERYMRWPFARRFGKALQPLNSGPCTITIAPQGGQSDE